MRFCAKNEDHKWIVWGKVLCEKCLIVYCEKCMAYGTVDTPSEFEWRKASRNCVRPYRFNFNQRVTVRACHLP